MRYINDKNLENLKSHARIETAKEKANQAVFFSLDGTNFVTSGTPQTAENFNQLIYVVGQEWQ